MSYSASCKINLGDGPISGIVESSFPFEYLQEFYCMDRTVHLTSPPVSQDV